ncbi:lycopene beta-cyclase [Christiangramia gaetbulicola]|uniref:Lycopene beta-cyclase n=1 Tax=Christiangramia gaetbulicola TaxID=703340 RepID=A0A2T6AEJ3_9FLAO|nr:lycopene cyclase family protein [Christiangramia gaetbulicola]PTX42243.1 lycopene beta-cyclase [Christiangramia gaetbulicola]
MLTPDYYYVIVGGGMAGLQLASRINNDIFFRGKKIAIIEPDDKSINDKTWCFWEKGAGAWDHLTTKTWQKGKFISSEINKDLDLAPYTYKMLRSLDFYEHVKSDLEASGDIVFIKDEITAIDPVTRTAKGKEQDYTATHFFDSRPPKDYKKSENATLIYQHFKGWYIKTEEDIFDPESFTMMDYRINYKDSASFTYVLPLSANEALVEFTFFTPFLTNEKTYDKYLNRYIREILKVTSFEIIEEEIGMIPMTDYPFHEKSTGKITKIGTAGGWVKASSGYSFKNTERKIDLLIQNIKSGRRPSKELFNKKFQKYDSIFLEVLSNRNDLGESLFTKFYTRNSIQDIFRFLDEETSFSEDIKIMLSLYHPEFLKAFFKKL